jgi:NAD(P)-dependent dehydrogenase (short-subunit alcohol dehydrogenase family)
MDRQFDRLDILVNNAGIVSRNLLHDLIDQDWNSVIKADLTASSLGKRGVVAGTPGICSSNVERMPCTRLAKLLHPHPGCSARPGGDTITNNSVRDGQSS